MLVPYAKSSWCVLFVVAGISGHNRHFVTSNQLTLTHQPPDTLQSSQADHLQVKLTMHMAVALTCFSVIPKNFLHHAARATTSATQSSYMFISCGQDCSMFSCNPCATMLPALLYESVQPQFDLTLPAVRGKLRCQCM